MDKSALVTGGTGGLGTAVTTRLLADGWRVVVPWIVEAELERLEPHPNLELIKADLFEVDSVAEVAALAGGREDAPLRAVANLVGGFAMGAPVHQTPIDDFEHLLRLNLRPTYLTTHAALPHLIDAGGGSIVAMSTKAAFAPFSGAAGYITSKAAVWALVSALAVEYKDAGIRVNAILPSVIDTPGNRAGQPDSSRKGWVSPQDIANVIAFLFGPESSAITGAQVPVPGVEKSGVEKSGVEKSGVGS
ncbi:SDR family NAD(P)-dependent oxidoreductase [Antrihabitans cavernicola]|uniref:SDR family NAD(P)-dependent oxidoreductase n=1 Tax=Antrihabitans cavernicola TaxID=2495913 RepID=A0A5A7S325_9NOCA|nr:SDR family NAD(P)-dependent oxidoreductase [Spelaeibacter cavernicola]KAA0017987.1 SDR family NAD(P)-dependent oxidoreductase [Spelaeibacter cavernicola]